MNLIWLEDFLALAATGNFSRAAEDRHSSQPAFSRRIRGLEEWVGSALFDRSTQPAQLTEVGEWFREVAQDLVARVACIPGDARAVAEASSSTLRVACTHALSLTFLPSWLRTAEAVTTLGPVQLMSDVLQRCEDLMQQRKVQFLLCHAHSSVRGVLDVGGYVSTKVGSDIVVPVSGPTSGDKPMHTLEGGAENVPILRYTAESGLGRIIHSVVDRRLEGVTTRTALTAHVASVLRTMAIQGRGIAWLPQTLVQEDLDQGTLVLAAGDRWSVAVDIRLYRGRGELGRIGEAFWEFATASPMNPGN